MGKITSGFLILLVLGLSPDHRLNLGIAQTQPSLSFTHTNHIILLLSLKLSFDKLSTLYNKDVNMLPEDILVDIVLE